MDARSADAITQQRETMDRALSRLNTGMPGVIDSFDASTRTCTVIPAIQMQVTIENEVTFLDMPPLINVPVELPYCAVAGFYITLPIRKGDPCWIKFSQRPIDNWFDNGGIQPPYGDAGCRHHDITDAVVTFAPSNLADIISNWEANGIEIRNRNKTARVTVKDSTIEIVVGSNSVVVRSNGNIEITAGSKVVVTATTEIDITSALTKVTGPLTVTGAIISETSIADPTGTLQEIRTTYNSHTHPGGGVPDPQAT